MAETWCGTNKQCLKNPPLDFEAWDDGGPRLLALLLAVVPLDEAGPEKLGEEVVHVDVGRLWRLGVAFGDGVVPLL